MRCLDRDRRKVLIGRFAGTVPVTDGEGRFTGRNAPAYETPVAFWPTVTPVRGSAEDDYFGQRLEYDLTITVDDPAFRVHEADILWVDEPDGEPGGVTFVANRDGLDGGTFDWDGGDVADGGGFPEADVEPHDYVVMRVARTSGFTVMAARRVVVSP